MIHSAWLAWRSRSTFGRVMFATYALLALSAGGYFVGQRWLADRARYEEWAADQRIERQLDRIVEMKFVKDPTFDEWLDEWSRQAGVPVQPDKYYGHDIALQLQPMPARDALQTFCRLYELDWLPEDGSIRVATFPFATPLETRTYPAPLRDVNENVWNELACRLAPSHFDWEKVNESPGSLQITAYHHQQVVFESHFSRLAAAMDHVRTLGQFTSPSDPAWQPQFIESDPAALAKAIRLLNEPVTLDVQKMPLNELARHLARQLNYPVLIDPDLELQQWLQFDTPVTCRVQEYPLGALRITANDYQIQVVPAISGHTLLLVTNKSETTAERQFIFAWPVPDLLEPRPLPSEQPDPLVQLLGTLGSRTQNAGQVFLLGELLVVHDVLADQQRVAALLTALRQARSGSPGLVSRTQLQPKLPPNLAVLAEPAELVYLDVPLAGVIADLEKRFGLNIEIEAFSQELTTVWCHLPAQPLRENLERMLAPYQLALVVDGPRVQILAQHEALRFGDPAKYEFEVYNIRHLGRSRKKRVEEITLLLLELTDDSEFRRWGDEGVIEPFQNLLVARERPAVLDRVRQSFTSLVAQSHRTPRQVRADAIANYSAPFFSDASLWETAAAARLRKELEAKLEQRITISFDQERPLTALFAIAKQYQLPIVYPGYQHTEVTKDGQVTFTAQDEALQDVLARFLPAGITKRWVVAKNGTLQNWYPDFVPDSASRAKWLFDVSDLLEPAGELLPGQLQRTLHASLPPAAGFSINRQHLHLGRFLEVSTAFQREKFQQTLHQLRTCKLRPLQRLSSDTQENLEDRFVPPLPGQLEAIE